MNNTIKAGAALLGMALLSIPLSGCNGEIRFESTSLDQLHARHQEIHESLNKKDQEEFRLAMMTLRLFSEQQTADSVLGEHTSDHYLMGVLDGMSAEEIMAHAREPGYQPYRLQAFHQLTYNARMKQQEHQRLKDARDEAHQELAQLRARQAEAKRGERMLSKLAVLDQRFLVSDGLPTYDFLLENRSEHTIVSAQLWIDTEDGKQSGKTLSVKLPRPLAPNDVQQITLRVNRPEDRLYDDHAAPASGSLSARVISAETPNGTLKGEPVALSVREEYRIDELSTLIERLEKAIEDGED